MELLLLILIIIQAIKFMTVNDNIEKIISLQLVTVMMVSLLK